MNKKGVVFYLIVVFPIVTYFVETKNARPPINFIPLMYNICGIF